MLNIYEISNTRFHAIVAADDVTPAGALRQVQNAIDRNPQKYEGLKDALEQAVTVRKLDDICEIMVSGNTSTDSLTSVPEGEGGKKYATHIKEPQFD